MSEETKPRHRLSEGNEGYEDEGGQIQESQKHEGGLEGYPSLPAGAAGSTDHTVASAAAALSVHV